MKLAKSAILLNLEYLALNVLACTDAPFPSEKSGIEFLSPRIFS